MVFIMALGAITIRNVVNEVFWRLSRRSASRRADGPRSLPALPKPRLTALVASVPVLALLAGPLAWMLWTDRIEIGSATHTAVGLCTEGAHFIGYYPMLFLAGGILACLLMARWFFDHVFQPCMGWIATTMVRPIVPGTPAHH
ncbi:hypothetical protein [Acidovorax sp. SUPP3334]|uniref:hypothetical protein n=1 Tax=Acidovorax sp. SUPP3334 TaxID=2920881 RepID=UPI0023DE3019|nr:hypothetical protein [Acidovorax sp. SUPP3334]GKT25149.1 hypothetical protein AVHM3334_17055 [Acidovorax sp. SUPP3334]